MTVHVVATTQGDLLACSVRNRLKGIECEPTHFFPFKGSLGNGDRTKNSRSSLPTQEIQSQVGLHTLSQNAKNSQPLWFYEAISNVSPTPKHTYQRRKKEGVYDSNATVGNSGYMRSFTPTL